MYFVDVSNTQSVVDVSDEFVREAVERVLDAEQVARADISVAIVDDPTIHELNIRYLEHDYPTDVLSFLYESDGGDEAAARAAERANRTGPPRGAGKNLEGELIVSAETAARTALEFGWKPLDELLLYLVHGLLHLTGYDDQNDRERGLMRAREREILALWKLTPRYAEDRAEADDTTK